MSLTESGKKILSHSSMVSSIVTPLTLGVYSNRVATKQSKLDAAVRGKIPLKSSIFKSIIKDSRSGYNRGVKVTKILDAFSGGAISRSDTLKPLVEVPIAATMAFMKTKKYRVK